MAAPDSQRKERMSDIHDAAEKIMVSVFGKPGDGGCNEVKAIVQVFMDPVSALLNLWASQRRHEQESGLLEVSEGMVRASDVYPRVIVDEDWAVIPDPPDYRFEGDGSMPQTAKQLERSGDCYDGTPGKYSAHTGPKFDWTVLSACEVVEWSLAQYTGDRQALERLLLAVHPDAGKYAPSDYPKDPFEFYARQALNDRSSDRDVKGFVRIQRNEYGAFRKTVWQSIGSQTYQDRLAKMKERAEYVVLREQVNAKEGADLTKMLAASMVQSPS